jgi:hypothetical protein
VSPIRYLAEKGKRDKMSTKTRQNSIEEKAQRRQPTLQMIISLAGFIAGVLARLSFEQVENLIKNKKTVLLQKLEQVFEVVLDPFADTRSEWERFYKDNFGVLVDFSEVVIPGKPTEGSWRLVFISMGLTMNTTLAVMRKKFKVWVYNEDLDANVLINARNSTMSYAVWVRDGVKPDAKFLGKSTRDADMAGRIGMTLLERLVLEVKYFIETGKHLDIVGVTFCTGSRSLDGGVPGVYFRPRTDEVGVDLYSVGNSNSACGLRQAE